MVNRVLKERVKARYNNCCVICGREEGRVDLQLHHIQKRCNNGQDHDNNLIPVCPRCHKLLHTCEKKKIPLKYGDARLLKNIYKENDYRFIRALNKIAYDPSTKALERLFEAIEREIDLKVNIVRGHILYINYCVV